MALEFCSFSSGSGGNSYIVKTDQTALLVDAGISAKKIFAGLEQTNIEKKDLKALLVTHEHSDHVCGLGTILKRQKDVSVHANEKTLHALEKTVEPNRGKYFKNNTPFMIGDIDIKPFQISHDAVDPVGYSFYSKGRQISIVTDTGCITKDMINGVIDADLIVLEANHDVDILKMGNYPRFLKERILGKRGHLSNETAGRFLSNLLSERAKKKSTILLAHLSKQNNFPEMAYQTVKNILEEGQHYIGSDIKLDTIVSNEVSAVYQV